MTKISVCDICFKEGKLVEAKESLRVKKRKDCNVDFCEKCIKTAPKTASELLIFAYGLDGIEITPEKAKEMVKRKW